MSITAPPGWTLESGGKALVKSLRFADFKTAFAFLGEVAAHAEAVDHHPEFTSVWNRVDFRLTSHDAGGITPRDVALADAIDALARQAGVQDRGPIEAGR
jgi:4a-hydroxytetrahydrobiopterin dehydratase